MEVTGVDTVFINATDCARPAPDQTGSDQTRPDQASQTPKLIKRRATGLPRMGKPKLPTDKRRVFVSVRVLPKTKAALESLGERNLGWALDRIVAMAQDAGLFKIPTTFI